MSTNCRQVLLGKIVATHGIKGQLRVVSFSGEPGAIVSLSTVILKGLNGEAGVFAVADVAIHGKKLLLTLRDFDTINKVLPLVGQGLYANREQLPVLPPGEYYWFDLLGLTVMTISGMKLGTLDDIIATGSNDVYVVKGETKEYLIPAMEDVVIQVNLDDRTMIVDPSDEILDL